MILSPKLIPELSHIEETKDGALFVTVSNRVGCIYRLPLVDLESRDAEALFESVESLIVGLPDHYQLRIIQRARECDEVERNTFRSDAIGALGFVKRELLLSIETDAWDPLSVREIFRRFKKTGGVSALHKLSANLPRTELSRLGAVALTRDELMAEFSPMLDQVEKKDGVLDFGPTTVGTVRLHKPGTRRVTESSLAGILDQWPLPFEVVVTARKLQKHTADIKLRTQIARGPLTSDSIGSAKLEATQKALESTALHGGSLCELEWVVVLSRRDEASLRRDLEQVRSSLSIFGDAAIETVGAVASFSCTRVGATQHFTFLEESSVIPFYLPAFTFGDGESHVASRSDRTLHLHRLDGSLHRYDQFDRRFLAYNTLICGKTGSGKSVLANALSSALMQDKSVRMIKIDVGGSYKKECEAFGGSEISFRMDEPAGVNPFKVLKGLSESNEAIEVLGEFICALIREEGETYLPKKIRAVVESRLKTYAQTIGSNASNVTPSLDDFLSENLAFPRRELLARWAKGGVFENVLKESEDAATGEASNRYRYFNFENIQAAANRDFSEGVMAAVITAINLEMLSLGDQTRNPSGDRLVLFCDETKFFIDRFAYFFLLTSANFRKFGHGLILMLQNIRNAEVIGSDGKPDSGLILNCPTRFFLQADTESAYLKEQFHFAEQHLHAVVTHPYRGNEYREAVLQDDTGTRVVRLYLTDHEYWRMTSRKEDVEKFNQLRAAVPGLTVEEAIRCLSISHGR